jgi:phage terminase large subunit-like protein
VLIEDKASGTQLIQELIAEGLHAVSRYRPQSDKDMRMHLQTAMIENGFVHLPERTPWLARYLQDLTAFPRGKHDDQVDSTPRSSTGSRGLLATRGSSAITEYSLRPVMGRDRARYLKPPGGIDQIGRSLFGYSVVAG